MAEKNCFQESFKAIKTVRVAKFVWKRVPVCLASVIKSQTALRICAKSVARNSEMIQVSGSYTKTARSSIRGWDEVISEVLRRPVMQTPVHHHTKLVLNLLMDIQPVEHVRQYCFQSTIIFTCARCN